MSSCQGGSDATGHLANWLDDGNLNVETKVLGRTGWGQVKVDLIWGLGTGCLCSVWLTQLD